MATAPNLRDLAARLAGHVNRKVRRGELSERALARISGYSQPHVHNVLHGKRAMTPAFADRIMQTLGVPMTSLLTQDELSGMAPPKTTDFLPVPVLDGRLGAGTPFPRLDPSGRGYLLPQRLLAGLGSPVAAVLDSGEDSMTPLLEPGDWVLLDRAPGIRRRPRFEGIYALSWKGRGFVGRCRVVGDGLVVAGDNPDATVGVPSSMGLASRDVLEVVRGCVVWIGRQIARA